MRQHNFQKKRKNDRNPDVLFVQYMRFRTRGFKIGHKILSQNVLKLNNVMYELTGIVIHRGDTMNSGHYYSITCCWDNGNAFKLNDSADLELVNNNDFDSEREEAYMLVFNNKTQ